MFSFIKSNQFSKVVELVYAPISSEMLLILMKQFIFYTGNIRLRMRQVTKVTELIYYRIRTNIELQSQSQWLCVFFPLCSLLTLMEVFKKVICPFSIFSKSSHIHGHTDTYTHSFLHVDIHIASHNTQRHKHRGIHTDPYT